MDDEQVNQQVMQSLLWDQNYELVQMVGFHIIPETDLALAWDVGTEIRARADCGFPSLIWMLTSIVWVSVILRPQSISEGDGHRGQGRCAEILGVLLLPLLFTPHTAWRLAFLYYMDYYTNLKSCLTRFLDKAGYA